MFRLFGFLDAYLLNSHAFWPFIFPKRYIRSVRFRFRNVPEYDGQARNSKSIYRANIIIIISNPTLLLYATYYYYYYYCYYFRYYPYGPCVHLSGRNLNEIGSSRVIINIYFFFNRTTRIRCNTARNF